MKGGIKLKRKLLINGLLALLAIIILPPILGPFIHNDDSPRSAIREEILKDGHPYQSFFAIITKKDFIDPEYGQLYDVYWFDHDSPTGTTPTLCYAPKTTSEKYEVSCGTGP